MTDSKISQNDLLGCIYCGEQGPYTDEHVFCAGLGGDDNNFLLKDIVCGDCNGKILSSLESTFLRTSPEALARLFLQKSGRKRGGQTRAPSFRYDSATVHLAGSDEPNEGILGSGGVASIMPKFTFSENRIDFIASDEIDVGEFCSEIINILNLNEIACIKKIRKAGGGGSLEAETYSLSGDEYLLSGKVLIKKPPKFGIWIEVLDRVWDGFSFDGVEIVRNSNKHIVLRIPVGIEISSLLGKLKRNIPTFHNFSKNCVSKESSTNNIISVQFKTSINAKERVLAKIGINMCAFALGADFVRHSSFREIKNSIISGCARIEMKEHSFDSDKLGAISKIFNVSKNDCHLAVILWARLPDGTSNISLFIRLYGGVLSHITLANNVPDHMALPIFLEVNYNSNIVKIFGITEFSKRFYSQN